MSNPATYTLSQIEDAINIWRSRHQAGEDSALCREARELAEPYTLAFLARRTSISADELTDEQKAIIRAALGAALDS